MWPNQLIKESSRLSSLRPSCTLMLFSNITGCIWLKFSKQLPSVESFPYQRQNNFLKVLSKHPLIYRPEWSEFGVLSERDGTVQLFGTKWQKFLHCPGTKRQAQNLAMGRDGMGFLTSCPVPSRDVPRDKITLKFGHFCCFLKKKIYIFFLIFDLFLTIFSQFRYWFCPGTKGFSLLSLSRDKGTLGQGNIFVPGQRDNGTSRPLETLVATSHATLHKECTPIIKAFNVPHPL